MKKMVIRFSMNLQMIMCIVYNLKLIYIMI